MSSTAFIEPLPVIEFVAELLNRDISARPLSDSDRVKVQFLFSVFFTNNFLIQCFVTSSECFYIV
jgi:hypothetical protein